MFGGLFKKKPPTLDQQLRDLVACGVRLTDDMSSAAAIHRQAEKDSDGNTFGDWSREAFEKDPYRLLLTVLGNPETERATNLLHFDTECIEDHGSYAELAEHLRTMAGDDLPLEDIEDYVDVEAGEAWLSFKLDGTERKLTCEIPRSCLSLHNFYRPERQGAASPTCTSEAKTASSVASRTTR